MKKVNLHTFHHQIVRLILGVLFSLSTILSYSQSVTSNVANLNTPNLKRLEILTFNEVNKLRQPKKLQDLIWDGQLYLAAIDHANYLKSKEKISHYQSIKEKKTPTNRVKIHGGIDYSLIGENIVAVRIGISGILASSNRNTVTYESTAKTMALLWKNSPLHYKNILSQDYNYSALAVSYDSIQQRVIAVQVFGFTNTLPTDRKQPDVSEYLLNLDQPELPYKLKQYKYKKRYEKSVKGFNQLELDGNYIVGSYKAAKKIFRGRKSGIAQEFVHISQFDSTSKEFSMVPNRRNGLYELNGNLSEPIYRRQLLKYSRKHTVREYFIETRWLRIKKKPSMFLYPLSGNTSEYEYNLFLIKDKQLAVHKSYIMIPATFFDTPFPELPYTNSFAPLDTIQKFKTYSTYDTLKVKIFYKSGEVTINDSVKIHLRKKFANVSGAITDIHAAAYASIEGTEIGNKLLALERMDEFIKFIRPWLHNNQSKPHLKTREQWRLFHSQIKGTPLNHLGALPKEEARSYVNTHKSDSIVSKLLDDQRYFEFELIWRQDFKEKIPSKSVFEIYDSLLVELRKYLKPKSSLIKAVEQTQLAYYYELSQLDIPPKKAPPIPTIDKHPEFRYHDLIFRFMVMKSLTEEELYFELHKIGYLKYFPSRLKSQLTYNNLLIIYSQFLDYRISQLIPEVDCYQKRQIEFYFKKYKKVNCSNSESNPAYHTLRELPRLIALDAKINPDKSTIPLYKFYYLYSIQSLYGTIPIDPKIYGLLSGIIKYFHPNDDILTDKERIKLAYFYCIFKKYSTAKKLVEPIAIRENPNIEGLKLYVTLKFPDFDHEYDYTEYLITQYPRLGSIEWCDLWKNPSYLNFLLLEDLKLKNFYNCHCNK